MTKKIITLSVLAASLATSIYAKEIKATEFLKHALEANPQVTDVKVTLQDSKKIKNLDGWTAQNIMIKANIKQGNKIKPISEASTYFTNGKFIANGLTNMQTGQQITLEPKFKNDFYSKDNLISGSLKSKHKIVIFSDPLCPFCRKNVPKVLRAVKKHPDLFAVYYYDLALKNLHPASPTIVKINETLRLKNKDTSKLDLIFDMYDFDIDARETNESKILDAYNKQFGYSLKSKDINAKETKTKVSNSSQVAEKMSVNGTPTFYIDNEKDNSGIAYRKYIK